MKKFNIEWNAAVRTASLLEITQVIVGPIIGIILDCWDIKYTVANVGIYITAAGIAVFMFTNTLAWLPIVIFCNESSNLSLKLENN